MSDAGRLQTLWDERLITHTMLTFGHSLDVGDWDQHASCFTDPVNMDFSKFTGFPEVRVPAASWARFARLILHGAPCHHLLSPFKVLIEGDRAYATVDMISSLWTETPTGRAPNRQYGWFNVEFERRGDEWKIARLKHDFQGAEGNASAIEIADPEFPKVAGEIFSPANAEAAKAYLHRIGRT